MAFERSITARLAQARCTWLFVSSALLSCGYPCGKNADLSSFCAEFECPKETLEQALAGYDCQETADVDLSSMTSLITGCGLVSLHFSGGFTGRTRYFDADSGKLVGISEFSDVAYGTCQQSEYRAGRTPDRDEQACPTRKVSACAVTPQPDAGVREGCRSPAEPGCARCCELELLFSGMLGQCTVYKASYAPESYAEDYLKWGPCPQDCAWCAACSLEDERDSSPECLTSD